MELLLAKAVSQLVLPPGGIVLLGALGLVLIATKWRRAGMALIGIALVLLWLLSTEPVKDALLAPLEDRYPPLSDPPPAALADAAIVVLGGGLEEGAPAFGGRDRLSRPALKRLAYAAHLARYLRGPIIVSGGRVLRKQGEPEGVVAKRTLAEWGIDPARVIVEAKALNTWENAQYVAEILRARGIRRFVLVTTAWHMPRSMRAFRAAGLQPIAAPCDYRRDFGEPYDLRSFFPRWTWFSDSGDALHEYLGMIWYRWRYGG